MTIVNDRVPDMEKYPPLPDLFLDNVPYIPWAFCAAEYIGMVLGICLLGIVFTHKHRLAHTLDYLLTLNLWLVLSMHVLVMNPLSDDHE